LFSGSRALHKKPKGRGSPEITGAQETMAGRGSGTFKNSMKLKILSWNIWIDGYFDQVADFLGQSGAEIIGLQEVTNDNPNRDVIGYLANLGYEGVFAPVKHSSGRKTYIAGPAIFSKYKIAASQTYILSETDRRAAIRADIEVRGAMLHVFSTHLMHSHQQPSDTQNLQIDALLKALPSSKTVVLGDFNATPDSMPIRTMSMALLDTDPISTPTWSVYPAGCSICNPQSLDTRLDYIFVTKDLQTNSFKVEQSKGSDHLPISLMIET
jgi:endonuclease/exonuclease/phosphatase family metal-dependent hydrolase